MKIVIFFTYMETKLLTSIRDIQILKLVFHVQDITVDNKNHLEERLCFIVVFGSQEDIWIMQNGDKYDNLIDDLLNCVLKVW